MKPLAEDDVSDHLLAKLTDVVETVRLRDESLHALMTKDVRACRADDSLEACARIMWECPCGSVPVVDDANRPIAMVSDRDIAMAAYTQGKLLSAIKVSAAMSSRILVAGDHEPLDAIERRMRCHGLHRLPVVDGEGQLIGILSLSDIAAAAHLRASPNADPLSESALAHTIAGTTHPRPRI